MEQWKLFVTMKDNKPTEHDVSPLDEYVHGFNLFVRESKWFMDKTVGIKGVMERYPREKFYTDRQGFGLYRIYGITQEVSGACYLHAACAMMDRIEFTFARTQPKPFYLLHKWSNKQLRMLQLKLGENPEAMTAFIHPMGWTQFVEH
jgi:hypothetical protein